MHSAVQPVLAAFGAGIIVGVSIAAAREIAIERDTQALQARVALARDDAEHREYMLGRGLAPGPPRTDGADARAT